MCNIPNMLSVYPSFSIPAASISPSNPSLGSKNSEFGGQSSACERFDLQIRAIPYRKFVED